MRRTFKARRVSGIILIAALVSLVIAGCGSSGGGGGGNAKHSVSNMEVQAGKDFSISLKSNPSTGYKWALIKPLDPKVLEKVSSTYVAVSGSSPTPGAAGVEVWTFRATGKGKSDITLGYVKGGKASEDRVFVVTVK